MRLDVFRAGISRPVYFYFLFRFTKFRIATENPPTFVGGRFSDCGLSVMLGG